MKITKADIFVVATLLAVSVFAMLGDGDGQKRLYLISEDSKKEIELKDDLIELDGGDVIIEVTKDGARFVESDCPNKICITADWVTKCGETADLCAEQICNSNRVQ